MRTRELGTLRTTVLGLGCWPIAGFVERLDDDAPERTVHAALDAGVRFFDTARAYAPGGDNGFGERQLAAALASWSGDRDEVSVATKVVSTLSTSGAWLRAGGRGDVRAHAIEACRNLGVEQLDLLQAHTVDPSVPWAETVGALAELRAEGLVREVGLSNVDVAQLDEARAIVEVASVQNEFGPDTPDREMLDACTERGVVFLPYSPFGGPGRAAAGLADRHPVLADVAARHDGASPHQVCLAWLLELSDVVLPIPAATRPTTITASAAASELVLTDDDLRDLASLA